VKLVFLGPPGAGKGTQAAVMAERFGIMHASTGDIFRKAIVEGTELGKTVKDYLDNGRLVTDELTSRVVAEGVIDAAESYILDGYPRTLPQAKDLERMLQERAQQLSAVVYFVLSDEEAVVRLTGRLVCSACGTNYHKKFMPPRQQGECDKCGGELKVRSDSSEDVVRQRLAEYHEKTKPLVEFYQERDLLCRVDASAAPAQVGAATEKILSELAD
jgi:adenylate kinase